MIATSGDEAFVMLSLFPGTALAIFALLFVLGIAFARLTDRLIPILNIRPCKSCDEQACEYCSAKEDDTGETILVFGWALFLDHIRSLSFTRFLLLVLTGLLLVLFMLGKIGSAAWNWKRLTFFALFLCSLCIVAIDSEHYLLHQIWEHIIKKHLLRFFFWSLGALLLVHVGLNFWNMEAFIYENMVWVLLMGALLGIIPESGPHLVFVMLYAEGVMPFSVLVTSSIVQDGHGMLPLLSHRVKDFVIIKAFDLAFGFVVGGSLFMLGF